MKPILSQQEVQYAIQSMIWQIKEKIDIENSCFISILKGGVYTVHKILFSLPEQIRKNILMGYLGLSSYSGNVKTEGKISITYPLDLTEDQMAGKNIILVDDIFDSGLTMMHAKSIIKKNEVYSSIQTAVLVRKMKPKVELYKNSEDVPDITGFEYNNSGFLVGVGMGLGEKYRCLDQLYELEQKEIPK